MPTPPIVAKLQAILEERQDLYPAIIELDSQAVSDLYAAIEKVADLCRTTIYVRTHWLDGATA